MALSGDLHDFSIPDVFRLISLSGKTGVLRLVSHGAEGSVWFRGGQVFFAQSDRRSGLLGERLVSAGRLTESALVRALAAREDEPEGGRRVGEILVDQGAITYEVLEAFVQEQIQDTIFDLFLWEEGSFAFESLETPPVDQDIGLAVSIENIVMEGARRLVEWTNLRTSAASGSVVFRVGSVSGENVVDIALKPSEWRILTLTDGSRTVAEVAAEAGVPEAEASRTLYGLFGAGLLHIVDASAPEPEPFAADPEPPKVAERVREELLEPATPIVLESEVVLAYGSDLGPVVVPERVIDPDADDDDAEFEDARPMLLDDAAYDGAVDLEQPSPPPGLVYQLANDGPPEIESDAGSVTRSTSWAGIGKEVAALTGAVPRAKVRVSLARPAWDGSDAGSRRIVWDRAITRDDVVRIHAGVKEL